MNATINDIQLATVKDSITIIELLYEDLVRNNIRTPARDMARRMLCSDGYKSLVELIDEKFSYHVKSYNGL